MAKANVRFIKFKLIQGQPGQHKSNENQEREREREMGVASSLVRIYFVHN